MSSLRSALIFLKSSSVFGGGVDVGAGCGAAAEGAAVEAQGGGWDVDGGGGCGMVGEATDEAGCG